MSEVKAFDAPQRDDEAETREWLEALDSLIARAGPERAAWLLRQLNTRAQARHVNINPTLTTPYRNTIAPAHEKRMPGDLFMERNIRSLVRWNALVMVMRANERDPSLGGHLATFSSIATLYDIGFNYFFRGYDGDALGDLIYFQGHSSPGLYARSYLEGHMDEAQLDNFRREVAGEGLSSYPHPRLMPDYWQFPTVSMGLGPIQAIYQAHLMKYQMRRELLEHGDRKVWCFVGDGECDEPETLGSISMAGRERLDNLIFVINCNLQRLDGPVRGNGKIIQELEGVFRGAGWNVIKVVWGRHWDPLLEQDDEGLLQQRMDEVVDGEYQNYKYSGGAYTREHFFGVDPKLLKMVENLTDEDIMYLNRGGHDPYKVYAAYAEAVAHKGQPTVILAKTVKGYGLGEAGEAGNDAHSIKKLDVEELKGFRDRFAVPISDEELPSLPYFRPSPQSPEMVYMRRRREELGGTLPTRPRPPKTNLKTPPLSAFAKVLEGTGERRNSTTTALVRILSELVKDPEIGARIVPIIPDEARTFGMEGMFRQLGIYSSVGQLYTPVDAGQIISYKEDEKGQILEEGINEAGSFCAWLAAATSNVNHRMPMIPFYMFYSMFGFQRTGDLAWAAGDLQARGFLIGATAGRTTLNGEGLQHQDGHSHVLAATIPNCESYDPAYAYELAVIIQDGLRRMYQQGEDCFYYITTMNESYEQPPMPDGAAEGIVRGMYHLRAVEPDKPKARAQLLGSGAILREALAAAELLANDFGVAADVWSVTSFNKLGRDGAVSRRQNMLNPDSRRETLVDTLLREHAGPVIAATDYIRAHAEQLRGCLSRRYSVLGTDGFGRSDQRDKLRAFFEVDRHYIAVAALHALVADGEMPAAAHAEALKKYGVASDSAAPFGAW